VLFRSEGCVEGVTDDGALADSDVERRRDDGAALLRKFLDGGNYIIKEGYGAGRIGISSHKGLIHVLLVNRVIGYMSGEKTHWTDIDIGGCYSAAAPCDSKNAHVGYPNPFLEEKDINCKKCLKLMGSI